MEAEPVTPQHRWVRKMESEAGLLEGLNEVAAVEGCCRMVEPEKALVVLAAPQLHRPWSGAQFESEEGTR